MSRKNRSRRSSNQRPNLVLQEAIQKWLEENPKGKESLEAEGIKIGFITALLSPTYLDEKTLFIFADALEKLTTIDLKQCFLDGAKRNLWGAVDHLPEVANHQHLLERLAFHYKEFGIGRLADAIGVSKEHVIQSWLQDNVKIKTATLERVLRVILRLDHPDVYEKLYPEVETEMIPAGTVSDRAVRQAINGMFGLMTTSASFLTLLLRDSSYEPLEGDQAKAVAFAQNLLRIFGVDQAAMNRLDQLNPLTAKDYRLLEGILGGNGNQTKAKGTKS